MSGVVVEVRVKEGQDVKKGDPIAGTYISFHSICYVSTHIAYFTQS